LKMWRKVAGFSYKPISIKYSISVQDKSRLILSPLGPNNPTGPVDEENVENQGGFLTPGGSHLFRVNVAGTLNQFMRG